MADLKPLIVWRYHDGGLSPNPWKVVIFLYELNLPFEMRVFDRSDPDVREKEPMVSLTPNGRMPVLEDPNNGMRIWESGAIIEYLVDTYDKSNRLTYTSPRENYQLKSWMHFQMSGQGPYYGQRTWFLHLHHEPLPSAQERYLNEVKRILSVIDKDLTRSGRQWLVGDKMTFVDLMFVPWNSLLLPFMTPTGFESEWKEKYPKCWEWHQRLYGVESVKKAKEFAEGSVKADPSATIELKSVEEIEGR
ncbi:hypothetical protein M409DRAFT_53598 [Zasmidium cellare ATCC 36951]|uniref:Glutathione S-transferase n=1 Tax=Zasmidium cellare ATCC 36951 TaxID=1080233 RepID=A0A6A6CMQ5_ZASCE|nr:uncharacterized protein M409DRAFT_53598 [Zasmidium cellare ATCC 36951]KAF2168321.1 hypothetical protein M409DRAFT_53598 [Zasmidium cellare ATCC 36951]